MPTSATTSNKARFIEAIEHGYSVLGAASYAGVTRTLPYKWEKNDPALAVAWCHRIGCKEYTLRDTIAPYESQSA